MSKTNGLLLAAGRSGEQMRDAVAEQLHENFDYPDVDTLVAHVDAKNHNDGEIFAAFEENHRGKEIHLFQSAHDPETDRLVEVVMDSADIGLEDKKTLMQKILSVNRDLMELFIMGDGIKRAGGEHIHGYLPYMAYLRQDKKDDGRVPITAKLMFDLIQTAFGRNLKKLATVEMHAAQEQGFADIPVDNIPLTAIFGLYLKSHAASLDDWVIVSPDAGGDKRAQDLAKLLGLPYATIDKRRPSHGEVEVGGVRGHVRYKNAAVVDDMGDTFGSANATYEILEAAGAKEQLVLLAHLLNSRSIDKDNGEIRFAEDRIRATGMKVIASNSFPRTREYHELHRDIMPQMFDLSYLLAELVHCNYEGESYSDCIAALTDRVKNGTFTDEDVERYIVTL